MKAVILAGGTGTRLWPLSRVSQPKQFQKLITNRSMLQDALARLKFLKPHEIYIATNVEYEKIVRGQAPKIPPENIIVEPALRDTAACIGLAAVYIAQKYPHDVMAVIYADHLIQNQKELVKKLKIAEKLAKNEDTINIIEVKAKYPNVNLGYVKVDKVVKEIDGVEIFSFEKFIEKPGHEAAADFLKSYKYLWNTGLYVWKIETILKKFKKHLPNTYQYLIKIKKTIGTSGFQKALKHYYPLCDKISIDYGIMEKINPKEVRIIPAELGWSDVGTWESIFDELVKNEKSNLVKGKHIGIDTKSSLIYGGNKLIATLGVKNLVIVETDDAILICDKKRSSEVKKLVEKIRQKNYKNLL